MAGAALVTGGAVALSYQSYEITAPSSSGLGGLGGARLTFSSSPNPLLAFWVALGFVPLLAIVVRRAGWPAFGLSVFLAAQVEWYALSILPLVPPYTAIFGWCWVVFAGACLNCAGSLLLRRGRGRTQVPVKVAVRSRGRTPSSPGENRHRPA